MRDQSPPRRSKGPLPSQPAPVPCRLVSRGVSAASLAAQQKTSAVPSVFLHVWS
uniref:Uncharacterized protein n=1 Tax=Arundo donax TaxID=35708 RepID=A0A0A9AJL6_ARUDO